MRVPLEWLKDYVAVRLSPEALAERLTMAGLEVTAIEGTGSGAVLDLEVTPNRADCLSLIGVAREVAAMTGQRVTLPAAKRGAVPQRSRTAPIIRIEDRAGCQRYIGRLMEGVRIGPSPEWLQRRLLACGARPINNVVDITNYVLLEYGQPLHAFDFSRLADGTLVVRRAKPKEPLTTLDGVPRTLSADVLVIADAQRPVAVAGVMGGAGSEVTASTATVLLESAWFDPVTVRRTARALGLTSESSYRFERGVDPLGVEAASVRASSLIRELAGGRETAVVDVGAAPAKRPAIALDVGRASRWLGMPLAVPAVRTALVRLSCRVASAGAGPTLQVTPPAFRRDLNQDVDLYEEIARLVGYDRVPARQPAVPMPTAGLSTYERAYGLRQLCASLGLTEVMTWSLVSPAWLERVGLPATTAARLANPLSQDHALLRPSLIPGLLQAVRHNVTQGASSVRLFELGHVVSQGTEQLRLGVALSGVWVRDWRLNDPCDLFRLIGVLQALTGRLGLGSIGVVNAKVPWAAVGAELALGDRRLGVLGEVSRPVLEALDLEHGVWAAELSADALLEVEPRPRTVQAPAAFPPVRRDLSFLVSDATAFEAIARALQDAAGTLATRIELIDRYTGRQVPAGHASLTFSVEYRDPRRTLTAVEVDAVQQRLRDAMVARFGAVLR